LERIFINGFIGKRPSEISSS